MLEIVEADHAVEDDRGYGMVEKHRLINM